MADWYRKEHDEDETISGLLGPANLNQHQFEDAPFDLPPEKEAYYKGVEKSEEHEEAMKGMSAAQRRQYLRGVREGLTGPTPKKGDINNPLKKDQPPEPKAPRQPNPMTNVRRMNRLARMARGRRR